MRIGINGFGRIGRGLFRALEGHPTVEVVAVNDIAPAEELAHYLQYDSFLGKWDVPVYVAGCDLEVGAHLVRCFRTHQWNLISWSDVGVEVVVEATRSWRSRRDLSQHLRGGAVKQVVVTANCPESDVAVMAGFNDNALLGTEEIISAASCTTQCLVSVLAPIARILAITTLDYTVVHQVSADQTPVDVVGRGLRKGRAAFASIIPVPTTASAGLERLLPALAGKVTGLVLRVPTTAVSLATLNVVVEESGYDSVLDIVHSTLRASESPLLRVTDAELVSIDYVGEPASAVVDVTLSRSLHSRSFALGVWFDNEAGYIARLVELLEVLAKGQRAGEREYVP